MKALIFEGIVTSGKSTVTKNLVNILKDEMTVELATEEQTHEPIMEKRGELHIAFFAGLINKLALKHPDLLIFDRLYLTQAYRAKRNLADYSEIEAALMPYSTHTIFLKIDEAAIADRIKAAAQHRGQEWQDYWQAKGNNFEEIAKGYIEQQRDLLQLITQSKLPYTIFDATNHDYDAITKDVLKIVRA